MSDAGWQQAYLRLHPQAALKSLEHEYVYHIGRDELYEIDPTATAFLLRCDGSAPGAALTADDAFVTYCLAEGLLEALDRPDPITVTCDRAPYPSLRYLELQLLFACNLRCRHCYQGRHGTEALALPDAVAIVREFAAMGGMRLLISGGEPMLYAPLKDFLTAIAGLKIRRVLLTNGTLVSAENIPWLRVDNIQFSLDGWREGHDRLRGPGAFDRALAGIRAARQAGLAISIATMVHAGNLQEFERLNEFVREIEATDWGIDVPCVTGALAGNQELSVPHAQAAACLRYAYGGGYHGSSDGFACGRHLMSVLPTGSAVKCGFYEEQPLGDARRGLRDCWLRLQHIPLAQLACGDCEFLEACAGGCRFRAPDPLAPDPVMCALYGRQP